MILRSIVILVAMAAGTAFALDHPRLPHRVLHVISPVELKATCPADALACAIVDWGKRTCHVYVPNAHLPGWPSRRQLLAHEFRVGTNACLVLNDCLGHPGDRFMSC
jgi:hypothetical protein